MNNKLRVHGSSSTRQNVSQPAGSLSASIARLSSSDHRRVYQGLVEIRTTFIKQKDGVARVRQHGGLDRILQVLSTADHKNLDVALSVLGNCCMESQTRQRILHKEGIPCLFQVMKKHEMDSIRNRACRTLANLALDKHCCSAIHEEEEALQTIVNCLRETTDEDCQQTYARALRILADSPGHRASVLEVEGLKTVSELLKSSSVEVLSAALKTVAHFMSDSFSVECLRQLISSDALASLLSLTKHDNLATQNNAKSLLLASLKQEQLRPPLGNAGAIEFLTETVTGEMTPKEKYPYLNAMCLCCHEVVNRIRIKDQGGLQLFLKLLDDHRYHLIHYRIISALVCFLYDDQGFETLLQSNVVRILLKHLRHCSKIGKAVPALEFEIHLSQENNDDSETGVLDSTLIDDKGAEVSSCNKGIEEVSNDSSGAIGKKGISIPGQGPPDCTVLAEPSSSVGSKIQCGLLSSNIIDANACESDVKYEQVNEVISAFDTDNAAVELVDEESEKWAFSTSVRSSVGINEHCSSQSQVLVSRPVCDANFVKENSKEPTTCISVGQDPESDTPGCSSQSPKGALGREETGKGQGKISQTKCLVIIDSSTDTESQEADVSSSDPDGTFDLSQASSSKIIKYSIDSPTYKEVSEWEVGSTSYQAGPTNIYESATFYSLSASASPDRRYLLSSPPRTGPYSPMSVSSYLSSDWSPEGSPLRDNSQSTCQSFSPPYTPGSPSMAPGLSPTPAALSEFDLAWDRQTRAEGQSPAWSSATNSNRATGFHSPDSLSRAPSPPLNLGAPWWGDVTLTTPAELGDEYSSEEETASLPDESNEETISSQQAVGEATCEVSEVSQNIMAADPVYENAMDSSDFGAVLKGQSLLSSVSADSSFTENTPGVSRWPSPVKRKRKESSPETKLKILKVIETTGKVKSRTLDINSLIAKLSSTVSSPEVEEKHDEVNIHKDPKKTTEHNILVLLSRISYLSNPSQHLVHQSVFEDMMDYMSKADKPLARCSRIMLRLTKNPHCLEAFVLKLIPLMIHLKWLDELEKPAETSLDSGNIADNISNQSPESSQTLTLSQNSNVREEERVRELGEQLLSNLSLVCETRYGAGVLEHLLLTGPGTTRQLCALCLPLLCWTSSLRKRMFLTLNGLKILINSLKDERYGHLAASSLHILAIRVNIQSISSLDVGPLTALCHTECGNKMEDVELDVTFLLDNGPKVKANRSALIGQSSVFAAMFGGHYSEASQTEINITQVTVESFTILVEYAHGVPLNIPSDSSESLDILLHVTALADRYNMPNLLLQASKLLYEKHLSRNTLCKVLDFALHHNNCYLGRQCLRYLLLQPMARQERAMMCTTASSELSDGTEFENYLKDLFTRSVIQL